MLKKFHQIIGRKGLKHENLAAGQKSAVYLKGRVFCRRADQYNGALFYEGEECVLLSFVEAVDLIDEEDGLLAELAVFLGLLHDGFDLFDPGGDR